MLVAAQTLPKSRLISQHSPKRNLKYHHILAFPKSGFRMGFTLLLFASRSDMRLRTAIFVFLRGRPNPLCGPNCPVARARLEDVLHINKSTIQHSISKVADEGKTLGEDTIIFSRAFPAIPGISIIPICQTCARPRLIFRRRGLEVVTKFCRTSHTYPQRFQSCILWELGANASYFVLPS
jgi:hypothetical protein